MFIMCVEPLIRNIENNISIEAVVSTQLQSSLPKSYAYADDITTVTKNTRNGIEAIFSEYERLTKLSGLELNAEKTELMPFRSANVVGVQVAPIVRYCQQDYTLELKNEIKINGILLSQNRFQMIESNVNQVVRRVDEQFRKWTRRSLSVLGKILIVKTFGISQIIYLMQSMSIPVTLIKKLNSILYKFIWNRHYLAAKAPERIKREIMNKPIKLGGLGMLDLSELDAGIKLRALGRMLVSKHPMISLIKNKLDMNEFFLPKSRLAFDPVSVTAIDYLRVDRQKLWEDPELSGREWYIKAIKAATIQKLINQNGRNSLAYLAIRTRGKRLFGELTLAELNSLRRFINPKLCTSAVTVVRVPDLNTPLETNTYRIKLNLVPLHKLSSKDIRLSRQSIEPICFFKIGPIMSPSVAINWAYSVSRLSSTRHKDIILRLIHGELYSKERLNRYGLVGDPLCPRCQETETLSHKYLECEYVREIWQKTLNISSKLRTIDDPTETLLDKLFCATSDVTIASLTVHAEIILRIKQLKEDSNYLVLPRILVHNAIRVKIQFLLDTGILPSKSKELAALVTTTAKTLVKRT